MERLLSKGEIDKEVYVLRRLHADDSEPDDAAKQLGLHFDLTVPFARYVLEHAGKLDFPFRRYQIQKVWRGERPQEGRYREFRQADIDVVGVGTLPFHYDIEMVEVMAEAFARPVAAAHADAGEQPQARPGLLPGPGASRTSRRCCAPWTSWTRSGRRRCARC